MSMHERALGVVAIATAIAIGGCGGAAISPQLHRARATMDRARNGPAGRLEPDELRVAERTLARAEAEPDGSPREEDLAYVAERQTRMAMANAHRDELVQQIARDQRAYRDELAAIARQRGEALETTRQRLAESQLSIQQQQEILAERERELEQEQMARMEAEERADEALERLRTIALVRTERTETIITLSGEVIFVTDRAELRPEARERLMAVAEALRASPGQEVTIEGHTDSRGSDEYNLDLSQRRADAVRAFLIQQGVPPERTRAVGLGESQPIASNQSAEGRANNRRVEIHVRPASMIIETTPAPEVVPTPPSGGP